MKKKIFLSIALVLLVVMIATVCVACKPSIDNVAKKFESKEYKVDKSENSVVAVKINENGSDRSINIDWYDDEDLAKAAYEKAVAIEGDKRVKRKGNAVAVGDEESIKIF
ncbi:MAG: hypothetical protein K2K24_04905 [Clostridia bacterium]|nr:hypothetical protein [Clostridia bacterium]